MARTALFLTLLGLCAFSASAWTPEVWTSANVGGSITSLSVAKDVRPGRGSTVAPYDMDSCLQACRT